MEFFIPKEISFVLKTLKNTGFDAFLVGGCVRDMLSEITPHDYDIATSATPAEIQTVFKKTVATGIKHGTVTVIVNKIPIEVTTFRLEGDYSDSRHPDEVLFVRNINDDLSRRDFTINALAYYPAENILIDLFGGAQDLKNKMLRTVGNPDERFKEDALRILRLFRFASVLDFKIDNATLISALKHSDLLFNISSERIMSELKKAVCGKNTGTLRYIIEAGALSFLKIQNHENLEILSQLPQKQNLRFFAFLNLTSIDIEYSLKLLKASNQEKNYSKTLKNLLDSNLPVTKPQIKRLLSNSSPSEFFDMLIYRKTIKKEDISIANELLNEVIEKNEPYLISHLCVNGDDLLNCGICGEKIREKLNELLDFIIENPLLNKREILLKKL